MSAPVWTDEESAELDKEILAARPAAVTFRVRKPCGTHCMDCGRKFWTLSKRKETGAVRHTGRGRCATCYRRTAQREVMK